MDPGGGIQSGASGQVNGGGVGVGFGVGVGVGVDEGQGTGGVLCGSCRALDARERMMYDEPMREEESPSFSRTGT